MQNTFIDSPSWILCRYGLVSPALLIALTALVGGSLFFYSINLHRSAAYAALAGLIRFNRVWEIRQ